MKKRVVFVGASRLGLRCFEALLSLPEVEVAGAVTAPSTFAISYRPSGVRNVLHADVAAACGHRIPCVTMTTDMRDAALRETVAAWAPDLFLVAGWYHMVPKAWRALAPAYGLHASILPDYAGGAPLVWALINGESEVGITLFQLSDGVDDGDIAGQRRTAVSDEDTIATLYARIEDLAVELVRDTVPGLLTGAVVAVPQTPAGRRVFPQRGPEDGAINWEWSASQVRNFVRAQTRPYPGAFSDAGDLRLRFWAVAPTEAPVRGRPGTVVEGADGIVVVCGDGRGIRPIDYDVSPAAEEDDVERHQADWLQGAAVRGLVLGETGRTA